MRDRPADLVASARGNAPILGTTSMKVSVIIPAYNRWIVRRAVTGAMEQVNAKIGITMVNEG